MKKLIVIIAIFLLTRNVFGQSQPFYYYKGGKIFLKEQPNKLLIKLSKDADKSRLLKLIQADASVQMASNEKVKEIIESYLILESKDKNILPLTTLDKYKNSPDVISALPMLEYKKNKPFGITDEFIVKLKPGSYLEELQKLAKENGCVIVKENELVKNQFSITVPKKSELNALQLSNLFYETGLFEFAEPNFVGFTSLLSSDPLFGNQWPLKNTGQNGGTLGADIDIEQAWTITEGRRDVKVAVLDIGIDLDHPDLAANLLPGYDALGGTLNGDAPAGLNNNAHGTACAGIIAARKNTIGISGVAPECKIIPINAMSLSGLTTDAQIANAIEWAWQNGADVLSNSWYWDVPAAIIDNAIENATTLGRGGLGCVILFSSGNFGIPSPGEIAYPAYLENVIAVGATDNHDTRAIFSTSESSMWGPGLDLVAPGKDIYTTDLQGTDGYSTGDYNSNYSGTSAACPHAAGVAALILSVNRCLTWQQVKQILELSCEKVGPYCYSANTSEPNGSWNEEMGHGRINAFNAVKYAYSCDVNNFTTNPGDATDNTAPNPADIFYTTLTAGCAGLIPGNHYVQKHEVIKNVTYPYTQAAVVVGNSNGYSSTLSDGIYYMEADFVTPTSATLRTYVYRKYDQLGFSTWFPTDPASVVFDYSVLSSMQPDIYLQNQTVSSGYQTQNAINMIETGSNITTAVPYGNYVVAGTANVTLRASKSISMNPGTIISPATGGYFYAYINPFFLCNTCTQYPNGKIANNPVKYFENYDVTFQKDKELKSDKFQPKVYPVPFNDKLTIEYTIESSENVTIAICDLNGQELIQLKNKSPHEQGNYKIEFNGINLPSGIYLLKINTDTHTVSEKIVKM